MISAYLQMFKRAFDFNGRTTRRDFWLAYLMNAIIAFCIGAVAGLFSGLVAVFQDSDGLVAIFGMLSLIVNILSWVYSLAVLIPGISMGVRRLHDSGKPGIYYVFCLLGSLCCGIGSIVLIVFYCMPSDGDNMYGPNQYGYSVNNTYVDPNNGYGNNGYGNNGYNGNDNNNNYTL